MAQTGGGAAYQRLEKPDNAISQGLQYWGGIMAQQGAEFRARNEREKVRREENIKDWENKNQLSYDDFKQKITGFNTYDDIGRDFTNKAMDKYVDYYNKAEEAMKKGDLKGMQEYRNKMLKVKGSVGQINDMNKTLAVRHDEYLKKVADGTMSGVDKDTWEAEMYSINGKNMEIDFDENDNPLVRGIKTLEDGTDEPYSIPYANVVNGDWRAYNRQELIGKGGLIPSVLDSIGSYEKQKRLNGNIVTEKLWSDEMTQSAKNLLAPMLRSDEVMADLTNQFDNTSRKRNGFTDKERDVMSDKLAAMVKSSYTEKYKEEWDKDYASHQEQMRHNKATEGIQGFNAQTGRINAATGQYNARTHRMNAEINKEKLKYDLSQKNPDVAISTPFVAEVKFGKDKKNVSFNTYQRFNKESKIEPFVVSSFKDENNETRTVKAFQVDVSEDGQLMRVHTDMRKEPYVISKYGNNTSRALFESLENQMAGRDEIKANRFGKSDLSIMSSAGKPTPQPTAPKKSTKVEPAVKTVKDLRKEYGY